MSIIYGSPLFLSSSSQNADLPPLLDNFKASVPVEGIPVKNMPVGAKIKVPVNTDYQSFLGKNITWMVIDHAHTGYPQNYTTLRTEKIIAYLSFDAGEPENTDSNRRSNGNNNYFVSNIDRWLNSDKPAGHWWSKSHTYDSAPTIENVSHNPYKDKSGFLAMLNSKFVNIILETPIKYKQPDVDSGGLVTSNRKVFLLSETELGGTSNGEGYKFSIYTDDESRKHYPTQEAYDNSAYKDSNFATNKPWYVWTRTQDSSNSSYVRRIFIQGNIDFGTAKAGTHGIVPVCNISSDTLLNAEPDSDGCYTLAELAPVTIVESDNYSVTLSADKMEEFRAKELAGAVWVYGDHIPKNVNDGTKIQLTREEITRPDGEIYITLSDIPASDADTETIVNIKESDGQLHPYLYLSGNYEGSGAGLLLRKKCYQKGQFSAGGTTNFSNFAYDKWCNETFIALLNESVKSKLIEVNVKVKNTTSGSSVGVITRKCFPLSDREYGGSSSAPEGTAFPYFSSNERRLAVFESSSVDYWTRSATITGIGQAHFIGLQGGFGTDSVSLSLGYRPAFCLPLTFKIKSKPNPDGSYDMYDEVSDISTFASSEFIVEKSVSWEQTKDFYARQFTYNSKKQYQTMLEGAVASPNKVPEGQPITNLKLKDKIKIGKYNNNVLKWTISNTGADLAISMDGESAIQIGMGAFDSSGSNRYVNSSRHEWLNAKDSMENGFLSQWSEDEINALKNETWIARKANSLGGGTETFEAKVVLHSASEIGLSTGDGTLLELFNDVSYRKIGAIWWTRSPQSSTTNNVGYVDSSGMLYYLTATSNAYIRPLCKIAEGVYVSNEPDSDGYYTITGVMK